MLLCDGHCQVAANVNEWNENAKPLKNEDDKRTNVNNLPWVDLVVVNSVISVVFL